MSWLDARDPAFLSRDGTQAVVAASFADGADELEVVDRLRERHGGDGVTFGGRDVINPEIGETVSEDLARAELLAFPILFLLSLWVFRGAVAALLPPLIGALSIVGTFLLMRFVNSELTGLSIYALNLVTGIGLGLAIDYGLFIVSRYREEAGTARLRPGGARAHAADRGTHRAVQRADRGRGDGRADRLPAALPVLDGHRRGDRHARGGHGRADRPARHPRRPGPARERAVAQALAAQRRGQRAPGHGRLVPPRPGRHATAGPGRRDHRAGADRRRAAVPARRLRQRRLPPAPAGLGGAPGLGHARARLRRVRLRPDPGRGHREARRRRRPRRVRAADRGDPGRRPRLAAAAPERRHGRDRRAAAGRRAVGGQPGRARRGPRAARAGARRRHRARRPASPTSSRAWPPACRSLSACSRSPRSRSCS